MKRAVALIGALTAAVLVLSSCGSSNSSSQSAAPPPNGPAAASVTAYDPTANVLNIVGGSEQEKVFTDIVTPWCNSQGLKCNFDKLGSVDQARLLQSGNASYDAFWFASKVLLSLGQSTGQKLVNPKPMFLTPVVFAGWKSQMEKLGFVGKDVSIEQVLQAIESKQTRTWITNPTQSNSGATVLLGFLNYFAHIPAGGDPLKADQLNSAEVKSGITRFVQAFDTTPPSTGTLMKDCVASPDACQTLFTYEDLVIETNKDLVAQGKEPLYAVYPQGSLAISDAQLGFYPHGDNPEKAANFKKLQDFLLSDGAQQQLVSLGRRPISSIGLSLPNAPQDVFNPDWGIKAELDETAITYPTADVVNTVLDNYQSDYRRPVDAVYCLDGSGSMDDIRNGGNDGWQGVKQGVELLFNPDNAQEFKLQVSSGDSTSVLAFDTDIKADLPTVNGNNKQQLLDLKNSIQALTPGGHTGIYICLNHALDKFNGLPTEGRKRLIILMSDGGDDQGGADVLDRIVAAGIPVITVGFGSNVDAGTLGDIAKRTGGSYISALKDLPGAMRLATGYK